MPQLFPMNWMILISIFSATIIIFMSILYFFPMKSNKNSFYNSTVMSPPFKW
uniref:ATP synthase F0 subunit 8 n=1 Tax=Ixodes ornithorhynchi TaxID=85878 RepID=UPI00286A9465|nr:ATP synthase F0 subunit 8 [Ixodes ornithorhynchi]WKW95241.1 ATP synthase subunit 8 [Ixodes ornithorhynchi]WKW95254.1 ATP synthase subunit 8 [Ixodes ornithorhynchi]